MESWLAAKRRPIALIVMITFLVSALQFSNFSAAKAAEVEEAFITIEKTSEFEKTDQITVKNDDNASETILTRDQKQELAYLSGGITSTDWAPERYWQVKFSTKGHRDLKLSLKSRGSSTGPRNFYVQYSLDNMNYLQVDESEYQIINTKAKQVLNDLKLPSEISDQEVVYLRFVVKDDNAVGEGKKITSGGNNTINQLVIKGISTGESSTSPSVRKYITAQLGASLPSFSVLTGDESITLTATDVRSYDIKGDVSTVTGDSLTVVTGSSIVITKEYTELTQDQYVIKYQIGDQSIKTYTTPIPATEFFGLGDEVVLKFYVQAGSASTQVMSSVYKIQQQPAETYHDPIPDSMFSEGDKNLTDVYVAADKTEVTTIGQVVTTYRDLNNNVTVILEDVIANEIVGLQIYDKNIVSQCHIGDIIKITGKKGTYSGVTQLTSIKTPITVLQESAALIPAQTLTIAELLHGGDKYLSEYVKIKNATLGVYNKDNKNNTEITDATGTINLYQGQPYEGVAENDVVDLYAVWSKYNSKYQLRAGLASECYKKTGTVTVDESITLTAAAWAGTNSTGYSSPVVYGDLNAANDQLYTNAGLRLSTGVIPEFSYSSNGITSYVIGSKGLSDGQYYEMVFPTVGYGGIDMKFTMRGSKTGAKMFQVLYSTDGVVFEPCKNIDYSLVTYVNQVSSKKDYTNQDKLLVAEKNTDYIAKLPASINHCEKVYIRLQVLGNESMKGETIQSGGVNRLSNIEFIAHPVIADDMCQIVKVTPEDTLVPLNTELTMETGTIDSEIYYSIDGGEVQTYTAANKPVLKQLPAVVRVYAKKEGLKDSITANYVYTQEKVASVKASPNGGAIKSNALISLTCKTDGAKIEYSIDGGVTWTEYTQAFRLDTLPVTLMTKATKEGYLDSEVSTLEFSKRLNEEYNIYFGQIHSHTEYSDGAGSCQQAFEYASKQAENIDFLAVTDHSNSFDNDTSANIKDGSVSSEWIEGHALADQYTNPDDKEHPFVGIYGYEMTWSGGAPGHMNTYNTDGFMSRNMDGYKNGSVQSLPNYYGQLKTVPDSISMFNHPGTSFGDFYDFGFYDEEIDQLITLLEVGNGEGLVGSSGYFPSYEYYTRALDKGWHIAPTNNQDNHKGKWGDANTGRTVVLADSLSRDNIYDALRNMRTYATEDDDLKIWYTLNGADMGTIFEEAPDQVHIEVKAEDPTDSKVGKVEVIVNGGLSIASSNIDQASGTVEFDLAANYSYYYIRITQTDGNIAVTAPVWISDVEAVGISSINTSASLAVAGESIDVNTTIYNNEAVDFNVDSIVYSVNDQVVHTTDVTNELSVCKAKSELKDSFDWIYNGLGRTNLQVTVVGTLNGVQKKYSSVLQLNYVAPAMVTRVLVDGTHNNDYVTGYYGGNVGNFADLASEDFVQVQVVKDEITEEMLNDCSLLIVSAPAKKADSSKGYSIAHFEDSFLERVKQYVNKGGNLIVCGLADYQDSADGQSSTEINKLLAAIGATTRLNSDEIVDDEKNGGQNYRLYFDDFNRDSKYLDGVTADQTYSAYSGCSILMDPEAVAAGKAEALVYGHDTTYSIDSKKYDNNYIPCEKGNIVALGHETLESGSQVFAAGTVFLSNFEVKSDLDNANDSYYANRNILLNIIGEVKTELDKSTIAELRAGALGEVFAIEGWVTAGTDQEGNKFFDTIYVQDETAGTTVFPIGDSGIKIGSKIRIVGFVDGYQGDKEIQVMEYKIIDDQNLNIIEPKVVSCKEAADYEALGGSLLKVQGIVTKVVTNSAGVDYFFVKDSSGKEARVFIDGYILASDGKDTVNEVVVVGNEISAVGLSYFNPDGPCLRVRDRAEVQCIQRVSSGSTQEAVETEEKKNQKAVEEALKKVEGSKKEVTVKLDLSTSGVLSKELLDKVKNTNVVLSINLGNGLSCKIHASSLDDKVMKDINLRPDLSAKNVSDKEIKKVLPENGKVQQFSLSKNGALGMKVTYNFDVAKLVPKKGEKAMAALYSYDPATKKLNLVEYSKVNSKGKVDIDAKDALDYVIVVNDRFELDKKVLKQITFEDKKSKTVFYTGDKKQQLSIEYPELVQDALDRNAFDAKVKYTTSNSKVCMVSKAGTMKAVGKGSAVITAEITVNGQKVTLKRKITVK